MDAWAYAHDVKLDFIRPGRPVENAFIESLSGPGAAGAGSACRAPPGRTEGVWSVTEVAAGHDSGAILMSLGSRRLRADAVAIVALTASLTAWGEL